MQGTILLFFTGALVYLVRKLFSFVKTLQAIQYHPGTRLLFSTASILGAALPTIRWVSFGKNRLFEEKHQLYKSAGWDIFSLVFIYPNVGTIMVVADAAAIKEITTSRARFPKPYKQYEVISFFGRNIIASEGEEWKTYRKISAPAFSDRNNKLVWDESVKIMQGLFNDLWENKDVVSVNNVVDITLPIALFVIGVAGFGKSVSWKEDGIVPPGHTMTYKEALHVTINDFILKVAVPGWMLSLTPRLRKVKLGFEELHRYMVEIVRERQAVVDKVERHDLLSNLLEANDHDFDLETLSEDDIISNVYIFLVAGHETTAHSLGFAFALLALYPDEQEKVFEQIKSVIKGRVPTYEEMPLLTYTTAVVYETLRLFPPVLGFPKVAAEDTSIVAGNIRGEKKVIPILKGSGILIDIVGIHYNPRYWDDPHTFNPSRFLKDWPRDAFLPFSAGARACIGRKFAETESTAVLAMLVSQYKEEPQFAGETFEERQSRVLYARKGLTLKPGRIPLTFTRR